MWYKLVKFILKSRFLNFHLAHPSFNKHTRFKVKDQVFFSLQELYLSSGVVINGFRVFFEGISLYHYTDLLFLE